MNIFIACYRKITVVEILLKGMITQIPGCQEIVVFLVILIKNIDGVRYE